MLSSMIFRKQSLKPISTLLNHPIPSNGSTPFAQNPIKTPLNGGIYGKVSIFDTFSEKSELGFNGFQKRWMSDPRGRSMRSKVEMRMQKEAGKTLMQIRRAKRLKLKLMTEEERLLHSLRKAKKKVALLLQKLKKYELPELPQPKHDPELFTPEQLQAYKKIGFKNRNYCEVGVRGVFGGVVLNMHMHWKFHETVQVLCNNYPAEKIKEMACILARLSGGIVINIHNQNTLIMFRGRNYRQPKLMTPLGTLTKRKALFKARFEQALESQQLNIKKVEQLLRRKGISPDDPVAMASIQRVASTFFNAIDRQEGSPYVFRGDEEPRRESQRNSQLPDPGEDSDQEELDKFIAQIEDAADKEWAEEEQADQEEENRIRNWNNEGSYGRFRPERYRDDESDGRGLRDTYRRRRREDSESESEGTDDEEETDAIEDEIHGLDCRRNQYDKHPPANVGSLDPEVTRGAREIRDSKHKNSSFAGAESDEESGSEKSLEELEGIILESDSGHKPVPPTPASDEKCGGKKSRNVSVSDNSDVDNDDFEDDRGSSIRGQARESVSLGKKSGPDYYEKSEEDEFDMDGFSESEIPLYESDDDDLESNTLKGVDDDYSGAHESPCHHAEDDRPKGKQVSDKKNDELWDSD